MANRFYQQWRYWLIELIDRILKEGSNLTSTSEHPDIPLNDDEEISEDLADLRTIAYVRIPGFSYISLC